MSFSLSVLASLGGCSFGDFGQFVATVGRVQALWWGSVG